jgi:NADH:ubiquinone oxidoreductase subunit F (NADH-binding)/(2Fe-2S) ferredoxin
MPRIDSPADLEKLRRAIASDRDERRPCIAVCGGTGCNALGNLEIVRAFKAAVEEQSLGTRVDVRSTGCHGFCEQGPLVVIYPEGICYVRVKPEDAREIVVQTVEGKRVVDRLVYSVPGTGESAVHESEIPFYRNQMRLLTGSNGRVDPRNIDDYLAIGGYAALVKVLTSMSPEQVAAEMKKSNLRGRGGAAFPAGIKWDAVRLAHGEVKYVICNCHEGDPGTFVDRRMMEANPHGILEGMLIGAYAMEANQGYIFVGDEFPLTVENTRVAIRQAEEYGLLGKNILGSGFSFTVMVNIDAGDYVCGETTSLMASIEGRVGEPTKNYGHASDSGLWAKPTCINNLQTWANVPIIINRGADWYNTIGTERSKGTRVFSLMGAISNGGVVEAPMGMTLREIVFGVGGGVPAPGQFKAILVGGPMGGFAPEGMLDLRVDFDEMNRAGLALGSGLVVIDDNTCVVDIVKYYLTFLTGESCGKCTPCRDGLRQMLKILTGITQGHGRESDIALLQAISAVQSVASLCGLGQGASKPLLSSIKHFRGEYDAHITEQRCPAGVCNMLSPALR